MVTGQGLIKLLDFGLAKLFEPAESDPEAATATIQADRAPRTAEGIIVGTAAYMSPEQAEGKPMDPRTDVKKDRPARPFPSRIFTPSPGR